jgi:hypothetical protein
MAATFWIVGSGNWATAADWSTGVVPGSADDAFISAPGGYTVSIITPITVASIALDNASATLAVSDSGGTATVTGDLDDGGGLLVDWSGGQGGTTLSIGGTLASNNFVGIANGSLSAPTLVTANGLADTGTIDIFGSASNRATLGIGAAAGFGVAGVLTGALNMSGDALQEFASGQITRIAGSLTLDGPQAFVADSGNTGSNSALTGLSNIAGTLDLRDGAAVSIGGSVENSGQINVDAGGNSGGSNLSIAGTLTNAGGTTIGNPGGLAAAPDTIAIGGLVNAGLLGMSGSAEQLINSSDSELDARQILIKQAIAAQLTIDNGDRDPGFYPGMSAGHDLIDEGVKWLTGQAPFTHADGSSGNVDTNHDGILEIKGLSTSGIEYSTRTAAFTSPALSTNQQARQSYVDPVHSPPQTGDIMVSGQDLKNALAAFNLDQLVTSMAGFQFGWNSNGTVIDTALNTEVECLVAKQCHSRTHSRLTPGDPPS